MKEGEEKLGHPEERSYCFDFLLRWINPLIQLASVRKIEEKDIWPCPKSEDVKEQVQILWKAWYDEVDKAEEQKRKPSLRNALWTGYGNRLLRAGIFQFFFMLFQLGQPFLVGELVGFVQNGDGGLRRGLGLTFGFAAVSLCSSICIAAALDSLRRLGVAVRCAAMMAVYEQALKLTTSARMKNSVGQTTNLMSIDAEKLNIAVQFIHFLW